jgi:hypothetical protein
MPCHNYDYPTSRREFLRRAGCGFGAVALAALMQEKVLAASPTAGAAIPKLPHTPGRAKNVFFLFMEGGPSHLDTFDYKPLLNELAGQKLPPSFKDAHSLRWAKQRTASRLQANLEAAWTKRSLGFGLVRAGGAACGRSRCNSLLRF